MTLLYLCSLLPIPILAITAIAMYRRKQHRLYPVFWAYVILHFTRVSVQLGAYRVSYAAYFYIYWTGCVLGIIFTLLLLRTIFVTVLEGYSPLSRLRRFGYDAVLLVVWAIALFLIFHDNSARTVRQLIYDAEQAANFTSVAMFVFVVGSSLVLGIRWTSAICGIAMGLGLMGTADLLIYAGLSRHLLSTSVASWIETLAYICVVFIYASYFVPKRAEVHVPAAIRPELVQWAEGLRSS